MSQKIRYLFASFFLMSSSAWANGWYVGGGAGPESVDFDQSARIMVTVHSILDSNVKDRTHLSGTGIFGTFFGGYGYTWPSQFYLAGELNLNLSTDEFHSENLEFVHSNFNHTTYKIQNYVGLSILPGYQYHHWLFYSRLGYANGNFVISTTETTLANIDRRINGFRFGLGINKSFTSHIAARMEYSQILYQKTQFTRMDGPATKTTKITPTTGQVEFSVLYNFA